MDAVLYADDDEDDDADFRFTVMVKEAEIVAELADLRFAQRFCKILRGGLRRVGSRTNLLRIAAVGERVIRPRQARDRIENTVNAARLKLISGKQRKSALKRRRVEGQQQWKDEAAKVEEQAQNAKDDGSDEGDAAPGK